MLCHSKSHLSNDKLVFIHKGQYSEADNLTLGEMKWPKIIKMLMTA